MEPEDSRDVKKNPRVFTRRGAVRPPYNSALSKYFHQRFRLFSRYSRGIRMDAEGWFSVTPEAVAACNARLLAPLTASPRLVVDAFVGCGGDAIQMALSDPSSRVLAVDLDPAKVAMARHNAHIYGVAHRIDFVVADFAALAPRLRADACFLSPPWGGPSYDVDVGTFRLAALNLPSAGADDEQRTVVDGLRLFELAAAVAPTVAAYLPASVGDDELVELAARHPSRRCERVQLVWGGGSSRPPRPRATLALFHGDCADASTGTSSSVHTRREVIELEARA
jgi:trimethylguanosine synthase